jgi:PleD family two-component response regulator
MEPEHLCLLHRSFIEWQVVAMQVHGYGKRSLRRSNPRDVVDMGVRQQDVRDAEALRTRRAKQLGGLVSGIDEYSLSRPFTADDEAILEEGWKRAGFEDHNEPMVLCAVDDLIFSIKIKTAATGVGAAVLFERNPDMVLPRVREKQPTLVIFDLNSVKMRPLDTVAAMKADPALQRVRTLGYVSHVQTDLIAAARAAGVDEVLARSAFSDRLGDILTSASAKPASPGRSE